MSSLTRRMQKHAGNPSAKAGKNIGLPWNSECKCCIARQLRIERKTAKAEGGHVL